MTMTPKSRNRQTALGLALAAATAAGPALADAGVYVLNFNGPEVIAYDPVGLSRSVAYDDTFLRSTAYASAALDTGTLRAASSYQIYNSTYNFQTCNACPQVSDVLRDVLTVVGPGPTVDLTLQMHLDGNYTITGSTGLAEMTTAVYMNVANGYSDGDSVLVLDRNYSSGYANTAPIDTLTSRLAGAFAPSSYVHTTANGADGLLVMTVTVPTDYPLPISMGLELVYLKLAPTVFAAADFQHTAQVSLSLPTGYSYTSASGLFLSATPVPEPAVAPMFAAGLALLAAVRRRPRPHSGPGAPAAHRSRPVT